MKSNLFPEDFPSDSSAAHSIQISVIIPTSNRREVLRMGLDALRRQTMPADQFEVLICDDGSTDGTSDLVHNYDADFPLIYLHQEKRGAGAARNLGLTKSRGELALMLNDDAVADASLLSGHWNAYREHGPGNLAILGSFPFSDRMPKNPFFEILKNSPLLFQYERMEAGKIYDWRYFWTCNISVPWKLLEEVDFFDENFPDPAEQQTSYYGGEDIDLGIRLWKKQCRILYDPTCRAEHYHSIGLKQFCKRQIAVGRHLVLLASKHPELTEELTGFRSPEQTRSILSMRLAKSEKKLQQAWKRFAQIEAGGPAHEAPGNASVQKSLSALNDFWLRNGMLQGLSRLEATAGPPSTDALRITFVVPGLKLSGGLRIVLEYCNRLAERGHRVTLATLTPDRLDWFRIDSSVNRIETGWNDRRLSHDLSPADLVFATHWSTAYPVARLPRSRGVPCYFLQSFESRTISTPEAADPTLLLPLHPVAVSHWLAAEIERDFGTKVATVPNAVDPAFFFPQPAIRESFPQDTFRIGMIYHPEPRKGFAEGYEALRIASAKIPKIEIVVTGASPLPSRFSGLEFHRILPNEELNRFYNSLDLFLSTSHEEGFGLPGLEALACGIPLVTSDSGGCGEYAVHEETALVCPAKNPDAAAAAVVRIFRDPELRESIRRRGLQKAKTFEWQTSIRLMEEFCRVVLKENRGGAVSKSAESPSVPFWDRALWRLRDEAHRRGWVRFLRRFRD